MEDKKTQNPIEPSLVVLFNLESHVPGGFQEGKRLLQHRRKRVKVFLEVLIWLMNGMVICVEAGFNVPHPAL